MPATPPPADAATATTTVDTETAPPPTVAVAPSPSPATPLHRSNSSSSTASTASSSSSSMQQQQKQQQQQQLEQLEQQPPPPSAAAMKRSSSKKSATPLLPPAPPRPQTHPPSSDLFSPLLSSLSSLPLAEEEAAVEAAKDLALRVKTLCTSAKKLTSMMHLLHSQALESESFATKAAYLFGSLSQLEVEGVKCRNIFLRKIQVDFQARQQLRERREACFHNLVTLLCQVYRRVRVAGGTTIRALTMPILESLADLLTANAPASPSDADVLTFSKQLQVVGRELHRVQREKLSELMMQLRRCLVQHSKNLSPASMAAALLLLELSVNGWPAELPAQEQEDFYKTEMSPTNRLHAMDVSQPPPTTSEATVNPDGIGAVGCGDIQPQPAINVPATDLTQLAAAIALAGDVASHPSLAVAPMSQSLVAVAAPPLPPPGGSGGGGTGRHHPNVLCQTAGPGPGHLPDMSVPPPNVLRQMSSPASVAHHQHHSTNAPFQSMPPMNSRLPPPSPMGQHHQQGPLHHQQLGHSTSSPASNWGASGMQGPSHGYGGDRGQQDHHSRRNMQNPRGGDWGSTGTDSHISSNRPPPNLHTSNSQSSVSRTNQPSPGVSNWGQPPQQQSPRNVSSDWGRSREQEMASDAGWSQAKQQPVVNLWGDDPAASASGNAGGSSQWGDEPYAVPNAEPRNAGWNGSSHSSSASSGSRSEGKRPDAGARHGNVDIGNWESPASERGGGGSGSNGGGSGGGSGGSSNWSTNDGVSDSNWSANENGGTGTSDNNWSTNDGTGPNGGGADSNDGGWPSATNSRRPQQATINNW